MGDELSFDFEQTLERSHLLTDHAVGRHRPKIALVNRVMIIPCIAAHYPANNERAGALRYEL